MNEANLWVVYVLHNDYEDTTTILGIVTNLDSFKKLAKEKYGILSEPIENDYGRGSLHYDYSIKKSEKYSEHYSLVAEPQNIIN